MEVRIYCDEAYPVYELHCEEGPGNLVDIDEEILKRWQKISNDFEKMQDEMIEVLKSNNYDFCGDGDWESYNPFYYDFDVD